MGKTAWMKCFVQFCNNNRYNAVPQQHQYRYIRFSFWNTHILQGSGDTTSAISIECKLKRIVFRYYEDENGISGINLLAIIVYMQWYITFGSIK